MLLAENSGGRMALLTVKGDNVEVTTLKDGLAGTPAVTLTKGVAWIIEGKFNLRNKGVDPSPFRLYGVPLPK
jgi:hypothetical protein